MHQHMHYFVKFGDNYLVKWQWPCKDGGRQLTGRELIEIHSWNVCTQPANIIDWHTSQG